MYKVRYQIFEIQIIKIATFCAILFFFGKSTCLANDATVSNIFVKSKDEKATLSIKISRPPKSTPIPESGFPLVLIIPGTRGSSDVYFDFVDLNSHSDGFAGIADRLNQEGVVVVRFDSRARTAPSKCLKTGETRERTEAENKVLYETVCWNNDEGGTIDFQTWMEDIATVFDVSLSFVHIDSKKIVLVGTSEGFVHMSFALANKKIYGKAAFGIGAPADSLRNILMGQSVYGVISFLTHKFSNEVLMLDVTQISTELFDKVGVKDQEVFEKYFKEKKSISRDDVLEFRNFLLSDRAKLVDLAKKYPRSATVTENNGDYSQTLFSIGYVKDVYINDIGTIQPLDLLYDFTGPIKLYYGSDDHLVNVDLQRPILEAAKKKNPHIEYEVFQGLMHGLQKRNESFPSDEIARKLAGEIFAALMAP